MSIVSERIALARKKKKLTQKELSKITGISDVMISQYERGIRIPKLFQLKKFADALDVTTDFLSGIDEKTYKNKNDNEVTEISFTTTTDDLKKSLKNRSIINSYIEKFYDLDNYGQDLVITVIDKEYERCVNESDKDPE